MTDDVALPTQWQVPSGTILQPHERIVIFASGKDRSTGELHTNFKLNADGEYLALVATDGIEVVHDYEWGNAQLPAQVDDISYGLRGNSTLTLGFLDPPTPGLINHSRPHTREDRLAAPSLASSSSGRGIYTPGTAVAISFDAAPVGASIHFTTDGTSPYPWNQNAQLYDSTVNLTLQATTILRAAVSGDKSSPEAKPPSLPVSHTFVVPEAVVSQSQPTPFPESFDQDIPWAVDVAVGDEGLVSSQLRGRFHPDLAAPTLSIVTEPEMLFATDEGIYANPSERGKSWERPVSFEWIEADGETGVVDFGSTAGLRIIGGASRLKGITPKHSFRMVFREEYGIGKLRLDNQGLPQDKHLFEEAGVRNFNSLILRNPTHDSWVTTDQKTTDAATYINDAWVAKTMGELGKNWSSDGRLNDDGGGIAHPKGGHPTPRHRWVHVYLDGYYWGVYDMVERPDGAFAAEIEAQGSEANDFDSIHDGVASTGDTEAWNELLYRAWSYRQLRVSASHPVPLAQTATLWESEILPLLDVDNFIDYMLLNAIAANTDWPFHNYWASRKRVSEEDTPEEKLKGNFQFYTWDSELSIRPRNGIDPVTNEEIDFSESINVLYQLGDSPLNLRYDDPGNLFHNLMAYPQFSERVRQRLKHHVVRAPNSGLPGAQESGTLSSTLIGDSYVDVGARFANVIEPEIARWSSDVVNASRADWTANIGYGSALLAHRSSIYQPLYTSMLEYIDDGYRGMAGIPGTAPPQTVFTFPVIPTQQPGGAPGPTPTEPDPPLDPESDEFIVYEGSFERMQGVVDLDVDSNNTRRSVGTSRLDDPERSNLEDYIETEYPGKIDVVDGSPYFTPLVLSVSGTLVPEGGTVEVGAVAMWDSLEVRLDYPDTRWAIWKVDGSDLTEAERSNRSGDNYIESSQTFTIADLGISYPGYSASNEITLFLECFGETPVGQTDSIYTIIGDEGQSDYTYTQTGETVTTESYTTESYGEGGTPTGAAAAKGDRVVVQAVIPWVNLDIDTNMDGRIEGKGHWYTDQGLRIKNVSYFRIF